MGGSPTQNTWATVAGGDEGNFIAPPLANAWTQVNFGTYTTFINSGSAATPTVVLQDFRSGGSDTARCVYVNRPGSIGAAYTVTAALRQLQYPGNNSATGLAVSDGTKVIVFQLVYVSGGVSMQIADKATETSGAANAYNQLWNVGQNARFWLRIQNDGTYRFFTYSSDGLIFFPVSQMQDAGLIAACPSSGAGTNAPTLCYQLNTTFINNAETRAGFCINPEASVGAGSTLESWSFTAP